MDKKALKVCYVSNYLPGHHRHAGGAEQAVLSTADLMKESGAEVSFLALPADKDCRGGFRVKYVKTSEYFLSWLKKYIEIFKWYVFQFDPLSYFSSRNYFREIRPDIAHFGNFQFLTFGALLAAKRLKIPVAVSIYDYWYFCPLTTLLAHCGRICRRFHGVWCVHCLPARFSIIQRFFLSVRKRVFDFFLKKVDRFFVLSQSSRQILVDYGIENDKVSIIRMPLPDDLEQPQQPQEGQKEESVLFVGWLQKRKGLHILLEAMSLVWQRRPQVKLNIVTQKVKWEPEYEDMIQSKLKNIPPDKYVILLGQREREEIRDLMKRAAVVVVPEQWENMSPLIVIEAMSFSRPVVASNIGGIPELIEDGREGFLAAYQDPADFAEKISLLLNDKEMREAIGSNAHRKVKRMLSKEIIANQYIEEYEKSRVN